LINILHRKVIGFFISIQKERRIHRSVSNVVIKSTKIYVVKNSIKYFIYRYGIFHSYNQMFYSNRYYLGLGHTSLCISIGLLGFEWQIKEICL